MRCYLSKPINSRYTQILAQVNYFQIRIYSISCGDTTLSTRACRTTLTVPFEMVYRMPSAFVLRFFCQKRKHTLPTSARRNLQKARCISNLCATHQSKLKMLQGGEVKYSQSPSRHVTEPLTAKASADGTRSILAVCFDWQFASNTPVLVKQQSCPTC